MSDVDDGDYGFDDIFEDEEDYEDEEEDVEEDATEIEDLPDIDEKDGEEEEIKKDFSNLPKKKIKNYECYVIDERHKDLLPELMRTSHHILLKYVDSYYTAPFFSSFEKSKVLQKRVTAIENGRPTTVNPDGEHNTINLVLKELKERKCPMYVKRVRNNTLDRFYFIHVNSINSYGLPMFDQDFT